MILQPLKNNITAILSALVNSVYLPVQKSSED